MTMSKSMVKIILMILGVIIFLAAYFLVFMDFSDKTDAVNKDIDALNSRLDQLSAYKAKVPTYENEMNQAKTDISDTLGKYYSLETPEDFIMFATGLEDTHHLDINALSFTEPSPVFVIMGVKDNGDYKVPVEPVTLTGYKISSTLDGSMDYDQMKQALDFIYAQEDVTKLDTLSISFDSSTGLIVGSFTVDKYYITGRDIEEHQATVPYTDIGNGVLIGG